MGARSAAPRLAPGEAADSTKALDAGLDRRGTRTITQSEHSVTADMTVGAQRIADAINQEHRLARAKFAEHAMECGRLLLAQKERVGYGNFIKWIEANCEFSTATANNYMKVAKNPSALGKSGAIRRLYPSGFADAPKKISAEKPAKKNSAEATTQTKNPDEVPPPDADVQPRIIESDSPLISGAPSACSLAERKRPVRRVDPPAHYRWYNAGAEMRALATKFAKKNKHERIYQVVLLMDLLEVYDDMDEHLAHRKGLMPCAQK